MRLRAKVAASGLVAATFAASGLVAATFAACTDLKTATSAEDGGELPELADGGGDATAGDASPAAPDAGHGVDAGCVPSCQSRVCGPDPVCGTSCGTCGANEACAVRDAGASCEAATIIWELDGNVVARHTTHEVFASGGKQLVFFPYYGRNVTLAIASGASGKISDCTAETAGVLTVTSTDNSHAGLTALPSAWKGQIWSQCGAQANGDTVIARDATLTANGPTRIAGTYELVIQGGGDRAGTVLKVRGAFDLTPATP